MARLSLKIAMVVLMLRMMCKVPGLNANDEVAAPRNNVDLPWNAAEDLLRSMTKPNPGAKETFDFVSWVELNISFENYSKSHEAVKAMSMRAHAVLCCSALL